MTRPIISILWLWPRRYLKQEDTVLLESDLIFEDSVLDALLDDPRDTLALVDRYESWMDGTVVKLEDDDRIRAFIPGSKFVFADLKQYYKTVNLYKFSRHFSESCYVPFLEAYCSALGCNEYYEQVLRVITMLDDPEIRAKRLNGQLWYEIDDIQDLDIASSMFAPDPQQKLAAIQGRYGGYWRYPKLLDFCYLVNPYYPPQKLMDEIKANFETLLTQYPSGMRVNSLLAAKDFGVRQEYIVVGNGAAELIKSLMEGFDGRVGVIRPTFEEYPHRCRPEQIVAFETQPMDFRYTEEDLMNFYAEHPVEMLVLVNPDNPSGNYISVPACCGWLSGVPSTMFVWWWTNPLWISQTSRILRCWIMMFLEKFPTMTVVKSISKSFGVPGLRLGVLASADQEKIAHIKKDVAIWNINSFAESYLQIEEKYKKNYASAMARFREVREKMRAELEQVKGLRVLPSQANYFMCELTGEITAQELCVRLLHENLLIKDLSAKVKDGKQFIRLAVRREEENEALVSALKRNLC